MQSQRSLGTTSSDSGGQELESGLPPVIRTNIARITDFCGGFGHLQYKAVADDARSMADN